MDGDAVVKHLLQGAVAGGVGARAVVGEPPLGQHQQVVGVQGHRNLM
jgi:hypothetical protein